MEKPPVPDLTTTHPKSETETALAAASLPPSLRLLKWLVMALMVTMIAGVITVATVFVIRLPSFNETIVPKHNITLPQGVNVQAVTYGQGWSAIVTTDNRLMIFDAEGALMQEVLIVNQP